MEGLLNYATHVLVNAGTVWRDAEHEQRLRLQGFIYPEGLTWAEGRFGTVPTTFFFNALPAAAGTDSGFGVDDGIRTHDLRGHNRGVPLGPSVAESLALAALAEIRRRPRGTSAAVACHHVKGRVASASRQRRVGSPVGSPVTPQVS